MKRRVFLTTALGVIPLSAATAGDEPQSGEAKPTKGIKVDAGKDRFDKQVKFAVGHLECKVSAKETNGAMSVFEALTTIDDRPPRHFHHDQDEWFYVIEGEYDFEIDDDKFHLKAGDSLFAPRKVPHVWRCVSDKPGRLMAVFQPSGKMESFFQGLPKYAGGKAPREETEKYHADHGMKVVGPPLPRK